MFPKETRWCRCNLFQDENHLPGMIVVKNVSKFQRTELKTSVPTSLNRMHTGPDLGFK